MTQKQFFNFIKAPFGKSFIVAFIFSFFSLYSAQLQLFQHSIFQLAYTFFCPSHSTFGFL